MRTWAVAVISLAFASSCFLWGQSTVPARMIVTIGHSYGAEPPSLTASNLSVTQDRKPLTVTNITPLRGDRGALELFVLVDNCSSCEVGSKFDELSRFIDGQPPTTSIGVAYIQNGHLQMAQAPTTDRKRVIKALSPPGGSKPSSPYNALESLIEDWKQGDFRRAVLMLSTGLDPTQADDLFGQSKSAEAALHAAQRAEIPIYAIYHPTADYLQSDYSKVQQGQVQLAHVASESGGQAYFLTFGPLPSLGPFLSDINDHLAKQYLVEFLARPGRSPGALQEIQVESKSTPAVELLAPLEVVVGKENDGGKAVRRP